MAYIPPHKRHSRDVENPSPTPESLSSQFNRKLNLKRKFNARLTIANAEGAIFKWFAIGSSDDGNQFPPCVHLEPFSAPSIELKWGEKPLALLNSSVSQGNREEEDETVAGPWESIVVNLLPELLLSVEHIKNELYQDDGVKPKLVARVGKVLFHGISKIDRNELLTERTLRKLKGLFYTSVSDTYMETITERVIPLIGLEFQVEKDIYTVKVSDKECPSVTLSCKCIALPHLNNLKLYKVEIDQVRHMVGDISCLKQNVDMRLMLCSKKNLQKLTDDEMEGIVGLINSAVLDQDMMGGLRWPLGKATSGDRFRVLEVWHTVSKYYVNPLLKLQLRNANRYDLRTSIGEASKEVTLSLKRVTFELLREKVEYGVIFDMLKDHLKLFWKHFVCSASSDSV
ncbi:uncharacterized protein LOC103485862 isoform X1 [Cucumis melo]|uniref:Uncharacterized protein LOC103485862 isoform X1 n=1 Tax=Cucumis melo TaxID=3656 RepID=A0ABM3KRU9_CUCME|nr:uncharacterized protein LOC103485862 isoform X1 [Cucumis melo]